MSQLLMQYLHMLNLQDFFLLKHFIFLFLVEEFVITSPLLLLLIGFYL